MNDYLKLDDAQFEQQFASCSLDPACFNHEAHLRLAWIHIRKYGLNKAIENVTTQLIAFVNRVGARDKYHSTLTHASIKIVNHFMGKSVSTNFAGFINEFPQLKSNFKTLINAHYSNTAFNNELAKAIYIEPDLLPFD